MYFKLVLNEIIDQKTPGGLILLKPFTTVTHRPLSPKPPPQHLIGST